MQNYHIIKVKYYGPTNNRGSRVKLTSDRFEQSIYIAYDYSKNNIVDMAEDWCIFAGFNVIGQAEAKDGYYIISSTFEPLK